MTKNLDVSVQDLSFTINDKQILDNFNMHLSYGDSMLVLGKSGSGKTTLISILAGLQQPTKGNIRFGNKDIYKMREAERDRFRGRNIGILFQTFHLIKPLTVYQNVELAYIMPGKIIDKNNIYKILERLGLVDKIHQKVESLSVGESQRVALARAIAGRPRILLCDEPTSSLDDGNAHTMIKLLLDETKYAGTSLIVVTHDKRVIQHIKGNVVELGGKS
jgi:putative ABC transport system ATP-binding protein